MDFNYLSELLLTIQEYFGYLLAVMFVFVLFEDYIRFKLELADMVFSFLYLIYISVDLIFLYVAYLLLKQRKTVSTFNTLN
jgi:hypothetical protein